MKYAPAILLTALLAAAMPGSAQTTRTAEVTQLPAADKLSIEKRLEKDMISMPDMVQALSRNLGQLHYLRTVCFGQTDQTWREFATTMMNIEAPHSSEDRRALIKAFNDGYYDQQSRYSRCSDKVSIDAAALAENARHLAGMLGDPYRE